MRIAREFLVISLLDRQQLRVLARLNALRARRVVVQSQLAEPFPLVQEHFRAPARALVVLLVGHQHPDRTRKNYVKLVPIISLLEDEFAGRKYLKPQRPAQRALLVWLQLGEEFKLLTSSCGCHQLALPYVPRGHYRHASRTDASSLFCEEFLLLWIEDIEGLVGDGGGSGWGALLDEPKERAE